MLRCMKCTAAFQNFVWVRHVSKITDLKAGVRLAEMANIVFFAILWKISVICSGIVCKASSGRFFRAGFGVQV